MADNDAGTPAGQAPAGAQPQAGDPSAGNGDGGAAGQAPAGAPAGQAPASGDEGELSKVRAEAGKWRTQFRESETARQAAEAERDAALGKRTTLERENAQLKTELQDFRVRGHVSDLATKLGFRSPELAYRAIDRAALKFDDKGNPTNAEELLEALGKAEPYLLKPDSDFGGGNRGDSPTAGHSMDELIRVASGR